MDAYASTSAANEMIGLGLGITPSGVDILIGFLAGLYSMAGHRKGALDFTHAFGNTLLRVSKETNDISQTYIRHAVKGEFSSSISALIKVINNGDEGRLITITKDAMGVGHSSGMDSITGLLIGLAVWGVGSFYPN